MKKIKNLEIAQALGISTAAVSLALNNKPGVSEETRKKVFKYIEEQQVSLPAACSAPQPTVLNKSIVFCLHKSHGNIIIEKPFFSGLMEAVQIEAARNGYSTIVSHYDPGMDIDHYIRSLNNLSACGAIILATEMNAEDMKHYQQLSIPYVLLDGYFDLIPCDSVSIDNCTSIVRAFSYVYEMGHRDIGYLQSAVPIANFEHRFDGFLKARRMFHLEDSHLTVFSLPTNIDGAYREMKRILAGLPSDFKMPTCFLSDLDFIAIGVLQALTEFGYRIPEDISIVGYDDVESCLVCSPTLTTIHLHQRTIGLEGVKLLMQQLNREHNTHIDVRITSDLVIRNSVKRIDLK